ncbi:hypothetical protein PO909_034105 [Leuciscus waleckii]
MNKLQRRGTRIRDEDKGRAKYRIYIGKAFERGETQPVSDGRADSAKGRHGLAAGSRTVEEYTYGITVGIATYGPSLAQVPPVHTSDRPSIGRSATSNAEGMWRNSTGFGKRGTQLEQNGAHIQSIGGEWRSKPTLQTGLTVKLASCEGSPRKATGSTHRLFS